MKEEIWKDIPGYEGLYQVSNFGRVKSLDKWVNYKLKPGKLYLCKGRILKLCKRPNGYIFVGLWKNKKLITPGVHQLVAQAFIPNPKNLSCINHKDENKENNKVDNLEWCTHKYNSNYGTSAKRISQSRLGEKNPRCKKVLCVETGEVFPYIMKAAEVKHIRYQDIGKVCNGKKAYAGGFTWQYV